MKFDPTKEFSVGIMVYNEVDNIDNLLEAIISQELKNWIMREIIVVSSGSTDGTDDKVKNKARKEQRIKLLKQGKRYGKCSAFNLFLKESKSEICILVNGDSIPEKTAFQILLDSFQEEVGLIGSRPFPVNSGFNFINFCVKFLWKMHHQVNLLRPKIGEMFLLKKNALDFIPENSVVDEAISEALCVKRGYKVKYIPEAIIYIKGPTKIKEFLSQRRRIAYGHIWLYKKFNYLVSTREKLKIIKALLKILRVNPRFLIFVSGCIILEFIGRILAIWDYYVKDYNPYHIWEIAESSKGIIHVP